MKRESSPNTRHLQTPSVLALVKRLTRERRYRERHRLFFVEGVRNFVAAVECGFVIETIVISNVLLKSSICRKLARELTGQGVQSLPVSPEEFRRISVAERASGIGAIVRQRVRKLADVDPHAGNCWIVLSQIRSPGNLGSLIRTSAAAGAAGFILIGKSIDPYDPVIVRASMGSLFRQTIVRTTAAELREWARTRGLQIVGGSPDGEVAYDRLKYRRPTVLVLGEERHGLDSEQLQLCETLVHIPMTNGVDSLNVATAGSLLLYEVFRNARIEDSATDL